MDKNFLSPRSWIIFIGTEAILAGVLWMIGLLSPFYLIVFGAVLLASIWVFENKPRWLVVCAKTISMSLEKIIGNETAKDPKAEIEKEKAKTHPHDVPKKLGIIDDEVVPLLQDGGPIDHHVRRGRQLLNKWKAAINTDRPGFLQQLQEYDHIQTSILDQIAKLKNNNSHFEDLASRLEILESGYNVVNNIETIAKGFSNFKTAISALGDPPYKMDLNYFFTPTLQNFSSGLANLESWRKHTEDEFIQLRKQIASGQA